MAILLSLILACARCECVKEHSGVTTGLLVATVAADYSVGALAVLDPDTREVADDLASVSSDPGVAVDDGVVIQLNRLGFDTLRMYQPGSWSAPTLEFSTGEGSNPQSAVICADRLFVSLYEEPALGLFDPASGVRVDEQDLSAWADADGVPELGSLVEIDGVLWVAAQRLDRDDGWTSSQGAIVGIDCASNTVIDSFDVGPSPSLLAHPTRDDALIVRTGVYYDADNNVALDGTIAVLDLGTRAVTELLSEAEMGENLTAVGADASGGSTALVLSSDAASVYGVHCLDLEAGTLRTAETTTSFLTSVALDPTGRAWVAARPSWADPEAPGVLRAYDLGACALDGEPVGTTLPPYDLAWM